MAIAVLFTGCASLSQLGQPSPERRAQRIEPTLTAAGFQTLPADSQQKLDQLKTLPQLSVRYYPDKESGNRYWVADAEFCKCLYVGDDQAYQRYQDLRLEQQMAEEQQRAARQQMQYYQQQQMMMSPGMGFGFGGPGMGFGGFGGPGMFIP